ncbi:MAG: hypothetical protein AB1716_06200 [Planctomycetota bacterium]
MRLLALVQQMQRLDRRIVYVALVIVLSLPFVVSYKLPIQADNYTQMLYDTIERVADDPAAREKVILLLTNWGPGSEGENGPQAQVLFQHLIRRRLRFVIVSTALDPVPLAVAETRFQRALALERRRAAERGELLSWIYGEDYINFGYRPTTAFEPIARTLVLDTRAFFGQDFVQRAPLWDENFPILRRFHDADDISLLLAVTPGDEPKCLCGIVQRQRPDLRIAVATMGIVANDLYPYVKSGQVCGLMNSARGAAEYSSLLDPEEPRTTPLDNSMSMGKILLLVLVLVGNGAYLVTRRAERDGRLPPLRAGHTPTPPLPRSLGIGIFALFVLGFAGLSVWEVYRGATTGGVPRARAARADDDPLDVYPDFERVRPGDIAAGLEPRPGEAPEVLAQRADAAFYRLIEGRVGEFIAALLTLGIFAFLLGDNRVYRVTEAFLIGGALGFVLPEAGHKVLWPMWIEPMWAGWLALRGSAAPEASSVGLLWALLLIPGSFWYFVYAKKWRWLNQLVIAAFLGAVIGPEFEKQAGIMVPQLLDTLRPVWPWVAGGDAAGTSWWFGRWHFDWPRFEHLVFVVVLVLALLYFVFLVPARHRSGRSVLTAGRLAMMIGFGAMFGNTVNTRISWLAARIGFLLDDWLGKLGT